MLLETAVAMANHKDDSWKEIIEELKKQELGGTFQVKDYIKRSGNIEREVYKVLPENHFQKVYFNDSKQLTFGSELSSWWLKDVTQDVNDPIVLDYPEKQPKRSRRLCTNNPIGGML